MIADSPLVAELARKAEQLELSMLDAYIAILDKAEQIPPNDDGTFTIPKYIEENN